MNSKIFFIIGLCLLLDYSVGQDPVASMQENGDNLKSNMDPSNFAKGMTTGVEVVKMAVQPEFVNAIAGKL